jgi:hypothetical protein
MHSKITKSRINGLTITNVHKYRLIDNDHYFVREKTEECN